MPSPSLTTFGSIFFLFIFWPAFFCVVSLSAAVWPNNDSPSSSSQTTIPLESDVCFSHGKELFLFSFFLLIPANSFSIHSGEQGSGFFSFLLNRRSPSCHTLHRRCPVYFAFRSGRRRLLLVEDCDYQLGTNSVDMWGRAILWAWTSLVSCSCIHGPKGVTWEEKHKETSRIRDVVTLLLLPIHSPVHHILACFLL